jgi:PucR family transcriptional regulator, purine catabolism regulatory protein
MVAAMLLRELLSIQLLDDAGLRVAVSGDLDRPVRWAHTGEISDIAQYLRGGEVLLTAATGLVTATPEQRRQYVCELAESGAAALIVELGRGFRRLPQEMVDEANERGLVVAELEREVPFVEVTQYVHTAILKEQNMAQECATEIGDEIARLVLEGPPLVTVLKYLAERLKNPVVLEDGSRHAVAFAKYQQPVTKLLRSWAAHSRQGHRGAEVGVHTADSDPCCVWSSIALRGEVWGRLHVLELDTRIDRTAQLALSRVASNIALYLLAERDAYLSEAAERSLLTEVAHGPNYSAEDFIARATGLGVDLDSQLVALIIGRAGDQPDDELPGPEEQAVRDTLRRTGLQGLVGSLGGQIAVVASMPPRTAETSLSEFADNVVEQCGPVHIGVSRPARASTLQRAFTEADAAHRLGPNAGAGTLHRYDQLVLHRLLLPLLQAGPELANFVESELGDLIRYDQEHHSELLRTLDSYLQTNGSKAATADVLFLQRRSVYYRLTRIEQLLGRSIDTPDHRMRMYLALRAREVLEARGQDLN